MQYAFCGNRFFVLEEMLAANLAVPHIAAIEDSYLEKELKEKNLPYTLVNNKQEFLAWLADANCNRLIANGCPYLVPVDDYPDRQFINIHPSYLPDLRGADPVPGAILHERDAGATCHIMDANFDSGDIITQKRIAYNSKWDAISLYLLSFQLEREVFVQALGRDFKPSHAQEVDGSEIYYTFSPNDLQIDFSQSSEAIIRQVRAFNNASKLARFICHGKEVRVSGANIAGLQDKYKTATPNEILFAEKNEIWIKKDEGILQLSLADMLPVSLRVKECIV